jgi:hypothetical protein
MLPGLSVLLLITRIKSKEGFARLASPRLARANLGHPYGFVI